MKKLGLIITLALITVVSSGILGVHAQQFGQPFAQTLSANSVNQTSAVLNGTINPNGYSTSYFFEYGTTNSLGTTTQGSQSIGSGNFATNVSLLVSNLAPNVTYYYRITAFNQFGTTRGDILLFST